MPFLILIVLCLFYTVLYIIYRAVVFIAKGVIDSKLRKDIIDGEIAEKGANFKFKIKDWFSWSVNTINEKGTASGSIKMNFPVKSALALALICFAICGVCFVYPPTALLIPAIFLLFTLYYLRQWWRALKVVKTVEDWYEQTPIHEFAQRRLARVPNKGIVAGLCAGLNEYTGIQAGYIRIAFIGTTFIGGAGIIAYGFLWFVLPVKNV